MSALDPYYYVKDEIADSVAEVEAAMGKWGRLPEVSTERATLSKKLMSSCDNIKWQLDELDKAIGLAERNPQRFSVNAVEVQRRRAWTGATRSQEVMANYIRKGDSDGKLKLLKLHGIHSNRRRLSGRGDIELLRRQYLELSSGFVLELVINLNRPSARFPRLPLVSIFRKTLQDADDALRIPNVTPVAAMRSQKYQTPPKNRYEEENDEYMQGEQERQSQILKEQDVDLDSLSQNVTLVGEVGLAIHQELGSQEQLLRDLGSDVETVATRLDYVQKKMENVIKKAGAKGQLVMIVFLLILLAVLLMLVMYT